MTKPLHSIEMDRDLVWSVPSRVSSSSLKVIVFILAMCPTIRSRSFVAVSSKTWESFRVLKYPMKKVEILSRGFIYVRRRF